VKPISILDLSGIPPSIQTELVGALLRIVYDALFWSRNIPEGGRERPLLIVLEEAHAYLGSEQKAVAAPAVKRIAKEGRKYGIGIMLVSQRPAEIDPTILSQCGTLFALRLTNSTDRGHIRNAASDNLEGLFAMLPVLRTGEAIIVGEAVNLPVRTLIDRPGIKRRPDSTDPYVIVPGSDADGYQGPGGWNQKRDPSDYGEAIELWRRQDARARRLRETDSGSQDD
jgi:Helicase HerA-like C-terminal